MEPPIVLVSLESRGHHQQYIRYIVEYGHKYGIGDHVTVIVTNEFVRNHPDIVELACQCKPVAIKFIAITSNEHSELQSKRSMMSKSLAEWSLLNKYLTRLSAKHCMLMYFDRYQLPVSLHFKVFCSISGINFRYTPHYRTFAKHKTSFNDMVRNVRQQMFLQRTLNHPALKKLFFLDPYAPQFIKEKYKTDKVSTLPDPVKLFNDSTQKINQLQKLLNVESGRMVFLWFGALIRQRKGFLELFEALSSLPLKIRKKICLIVVGQQVWDDDQETDVKDKLIALEKDLSVQVIKKYDFIPEEDIQSYFYIADVVLMPYQRHVGMSGVLNRAAIAGKPVLGPSYGLLGKLIKRYKLGLSVDTKQPDDIATGLVRFVNSSSTQLFDLEAMADFATMHSPEEFSRTILQHLRLGNIE